MKAFSTPVTAEIIGIRLCKEVEALELVTGELD